MYIITTVNLYGKQAGVFVSLDLLSSQLREHPTQYGTGTNWHIFGTKCLDLV